MPPTEEMIEKAAECLENLEGTMTASPTSIMPGQTSNLKWNVTTTPSAGCAVHLYLGNSPVQKSGTRLVEPGNTTTYHLVGKMFTVRRILCSVTVFVDTSRCITRSLDEETVRQMVQSLLATALAGTPLSQRSPASLEIDRKGIAVKLRLKVAVPNFFDPNLNIDMVISVRAVGHQVVVAYVSYSNDLDWPWWVTTITLGASKFIEELLESKIEKKVKPLLLEKLKEQIDSMLVSLPDTYQLHSLITEPDEIRVTVCPSTP